MGFLFHRIHNVDPVFRMSQAIGHELSHHDQLVLDRVFESYMRACGNSLSWTGRRDM
jgi:hypothetical protein